LIRVRATSAIALAGPAPARARAARRGFTLVELLITISIVGIMASMILFALFQSQETAKAHRTRALITKLNTIIMRRYDEYRTRRVPIQFNPTELANPKLMARMRMEGLRDLMRMEMPDRWTDVLRPPAAPFNRPAIAPPAAFLAYQAKWAAITGATTIGPYEYDPNSSVSVSKEEHQSAECLYMIVMGTLAQEGDSRDTFTAKDVGDVDNDGFPEFVDAWGQPIRFLRWAPGLTSGIQVRGVTSPSSPSTPGNSMTVTFNGAQFSTTPGSYVGGVLAVIDPTTKHIDGTRMGQIVGYQHNGISAIFSFETPSGQPQPFAGGVPQTSDLIAILNPDPFDSRGVYPDYIPPVNPATVTPNFGLVPFIYSAGPDRVYGITPNTNPGLEYSTTARLNPCFVNAGGFLIGEPGDGNLDNITNHQLTTR